MAQKKSDKKLMVSTQENKLLAAISYIPPLWVIPLWLKKPRESFSVFHAKQGFGLFLFAIAANILTMFPLLGHLLRPLVALFVLIFFVCGVVYALMGRKQQMPIIGASLDKWFTDL